jgi:hypothetical protein
MSSNQRKKKYMLAQFGDASDNSEIIFKRYYFTVEQRCDGQPEEKYFDYFVFNIVDYSVNCGLPRSGARRRALAQTIGNARGLDINSPRSAKNHPQDMRFRRHQQRDNSTSARGLDNNSASDRSCDSTTSTRRPLRPRLRSAASTTSASTSTASSSTTPRRLCRTR